MMLTECFVILEKFHAILSKPLKISLIFFNMHRTSDVIPALRMGSEAQEFQCCVVRHRAN